MFYNLETWYEHDLVGNPVFSHIDSNVYLIICGNKRKTANKKQGNICHFRMELNSIFYVFCIDLLVITFIFNFAMTVVEKN